jgi:hypothetical protein
MPHGAAMRGAERYQQKRVSDAIEACLMRDARAVRAKARMFAVAARSSAMRAWRERGSAAIVERDGAAVWRRCGVNIRG